MDGSDGSDELRTAAANVVAALVDKVDEILPVEDANFPPDLARRRHKAFFTFLERGPPSLGQGYYYYGLLDCVSQLATVSDLSMLGEGLRDRLNGLIFESVEPEFRWKAVSPPNFCDGLSPVRNRSVSAKTNHRLKSFCPVLALARNSINYWDGISGNESASRLKQAFVKK